MAEMRIRIMHSAMLETRTEIDKNDTVYTKTA